MRVVIGKKIRGLKEWRFNPALWGVVCLSAIIGGLYGDPIGPGSPSRKMANDRVVKDYITALGYVEDRYVVTPDKESLTRSSIMSMLHTLDPHSNFFDRRDFNEMQDEQSSRFYGIGVTVNQRNGRIYVIGVSRDMPAHRAGLRYGDAIVGVNGVSTTDWTQLDAMKNVRGERGTEVMISVERAGNKEPFTVKIQRDEVPFPSVRNFFLIRAGIGYVGLTGGFNQDTSEELSRAIAELRGQGMESLILDLRRNPGGLLKQAIEVCETFLPKGVEIVSVRGRTGRNNDQVYRSENPKPEKMPLVVMINGETASASEIVAGALQDLRRGWVVGEESFGKGLVQTVYRLRGGTGLTLTTAKYYTPSGRSIQRTYNNRGFYDYFYSRRDYEPGDRQMVKAPGDKIASGGIMPDKVIKIAEENIKIRDACFEFVRQLVYGQIAGLANFSLSSVKYNHQLRDVDRRVVDEFIEPFSGFIRNHPELQISEIQIVRNIDYVRRRIQAELITAAYGIEVAERFLIESDKQALRAIGEIPKARKLIDRAHLFEPGGVEP